MLLKEQQQQKGKGKFVVTEDEPSSSVTVDRFEFGSDLQHSGDESEQWSANTVL